jgi:hypothetical protein
LQVVALRLSSTDRERLAAHGHRAADAVRALLALADEHATCPPPRKSTHRAAPSKVSASTVFQPPVPPVTYVVRDRDGKVVYRSTVKANARYRAGLLPGLTVEESSS